MFAKEKEREREEKEASMRNVRALLSQNSDDPELRPRMQNVSNVFYNFNENSLARYMKKNNFSLPQRFFEHDFQNTLKNN